MRKSVVSRKKAPKISYFTKVSLHFYLFIASIAIVVLISFVVISPFFKADYNTITHASTNSASPIRYVWLIQEENSSWTGSTEPLKGDPNAPYINNTLAPAASHAEAYFDSVHPSLPNYIQFESGDNYGITDDSPPSQHKLTSTNHLATYLTTAGLSWKAYLEDISGTTCPFTGVKQYVPRHNGTIYFTDVNGNLNANFPYCISHERPYSELANDLLGGKIQNFNYIVPNLCHNFHGATNCGSTNLVTRGDTFLKTIILEITATQQYQTAGAIIVWFDEGHDDPTGADSNGPLPFFVLSPFAKGNGYFNTISYNHFSPLKTIQEIFGLYPLLAHAGDPSTNDVSDLFQPGVIPTPAMSPTITLNPSISPTPTLFPTLTIPPTATTTPSPTPILGQIIAQDTFQRPNQVFWGIASDGNVWRGDANTKNGFSLVSSTGLITGTNMNAVLGPSLTNSEVLISGSMSVLNSANVLGPVLHWNNTNMLYKAFINGSSLMLQKNVNGAVTQLKSVPFIASAHTLYSIRFNITGTILSAKAWPTGAAEPVNWMVTANDSSISSGFCGIKAVQQSGTTTTITSFQATQQ